MLTVFILYLYLCFSQRYLFTNVLIGAMQSQNRCLTWLEEASAGSCEIQLLTVVGNMHFDDIIFCIKKATESRASSQIGSENLHISAHLQSNNNFSPSLFMATPQLSN